METDQVDLCRCLYKLHFQQLLLLESYTKLLQLSALLSEHAQQLLVISSNK